MKKPSIVVLGSSNTDMVIRAARIPQPGETIMGGSFFMNAGGKGANQAVAAARLGGNISFIAKIGSDIFGDEALQLFQKEGIDTSAVLRDPSLPSGIALITVDEEGENSIVVASGANASLGGSDVLRHEKMISGAAILLMQLETAIDTVSHAASLAHAAGVRVILNPAPAHQLPADLLQHIHIITPNRREAEMLTGLSIHDKSGAETAARQLQERGIETVIITMGAAGALLIEQGTSQMIASPKVKAVDTTAAGDVFNGALAVALSEEMDMTSAVHFACLAASVSVTRLGAQASAPFRSEIS